MWGERQNYDFISGVCIMNGEGTTTLQYKNCVIYGD